MADKDVVVRLSIQPDDAAQAKVDAAIAKTESSLQRLTVAQGGVATSADRMGSELQSVWKQYTDEVLQAKEATDELADSTKDVSQSASGMGNISGLRRTGSALTQLGLGEIGRPVMIAGDIAQVGKEFGQITEAVKPLVEGLANVGGGVAPLTAAFTGLGGSLGVVLAAAAPVAIALGGVVVAFKVFEDHLKESREALKAALNSQLDYYQAVQTLTTQEAEIKKASLEKTLEGEKQAKAETERAIEALQKQTNINMELGKTLPGSLGDPFRQLAAQLDKNNEALTNTGTELERYTGGLKSNAFALNDATEAALKNASAAAKIQAELRADDALSADAAKKKLDAQRELLTQEYDELNALVASGDQSEKVQNRIKELNKEIGNTSDEIEHLTSSVIPAAQSLERLSRAAEEADKAAEELAKAQEAKDKASADAVKKYDDDVVKIQEQGAQAKLAIEQKYADTLVSIAEKALQQAQDDLRKLKDQQAQNLVSYQRGELDAQEKAQYDQQTRQIKYQEETVKSYQAHLDKLRDIQRNAQQQQAEDILDRNFLALFKNQLATNASIEGENTTFGRSERDRSRTEQIANADAQRQTAFDHQMRIQAYERANQDARRNYEIQLRDQSIADQRARVQATQAERVAQTDLQQKITQELSIRRSGIVAELKLIQMGEEQQLALRKRYLDQATALLSGRSGGYNAPAAGQMTTRAIQIQQNFNIPQTDPRILAQQSALQNIQALRKLTGAGV